MNEPIWVDHSVVNTTHDIMLAKHGGTSGIGDEGLLESLLTRPINSHVYAKQTCALWPRVTPTELLAITFILMGTNILHFSQLMFS